MVYTSSADIIGEFLNDLPATQRDRAETLILGDLSMQVPPSTAEAVIARTRQTLRTLHGETVYTTDERGDRVCVDAEDHQKRMRGKV